MEEVDETVFAAILSFLTPKEACKLGCVSKTFQAWVEVSSRWKVWCEQACPSLKLPLAELIVTAHCGSGLESGRFYKRLYAELEKGTQHRILSPESFEEVADEKYSEDLKALGHELQDLVLLMDVHAGEEVLVSVCADGSDDFEPIRSVHECLDTALEGAKAEARLYAVLNQCVKKFDTAFQLKDVEEGAEEAVLRARRNLLTFSLRLMSKSGGTVRMALKREVAFRFSAEKGSTSPWLRLGWYELKEGHASRYLAFSLLNPDRLSMDNISERNMRELCYRIFSVAQTCEANYENWYREGSPPVTYGVNIGTHS